MTVAILIVLLVAIAATVVHLVAESLRHERSRREALRRHMAASKVINAEVSRD
jgi:bacterioferritin (cytochrome b1)